MENQMTLHAVLFQVNFDKKFGGWMVVTAAWGCDILTHPADPSIQSFCGLRSLLRVYGPCYDAGVQLHW